MSLLGSLGSDGGGDETWTTLSDVRRRPRSDGDVSEPLDSDVMSSRLKCFRVEYFGAEWPLSNLSRHFQHFQYAIWRKKNLPGVDGEVVGSVWDGFIEARDRLRVRTLCSVLGWHGPGMDFRLMPMGRMRREDARAQVMNKGPDGMTDAVEWGQWRMNAQDQQFIELQQRAASGDSLEDLRIAFPSLVAKHYYYVTRMVADFDRKRAQQPREVNVWLFYGKTGTGKTTVAYKQALELVGGDPCKVYILDNTTATGKICGTVWFDGYTGQKCLVLDDYMGREYPVNQMLRWLDGKIPLQIPIKGSMTQARWTHVWITTNIPFDMWQDAGCPMVPESRDALWRRINHVYRFTDVGVWEVEKGV